MPILGRMSKWTMGCVLATGIAFNGMAVQAQGRPELLVVNQGDRSLSVIDAGTGQLVATVPVGGVTGHEVAVSPDGRTAYVPIYGNSGVGKPGTDGKSIAVIDLQARKVRGTVEFDHGVRPHCPRYDARRNVLYVTSELDHSISVINPATLKVVGAIPTGEAESHMLVVAHNGTRGYTANVASGTVSVLDMDGRKTVAVIAVASHVQRIAISPDDKMVFTSDQEQPRLAVIDTATNKVARWIPLPSISYGTAVTPDGRYLIATLREAGKVAIVDLHSFSVVRTLEVGNVPVEVIVRPDGQVAYVSCTKDAEVAELALGGDVGSWHVARKVKAGAAADGLAWVAR